MIIRMDPALEILNRAVIGDPSALAFLDRTSSLYILDATDPSKPKTYGGWNYIHQALNEVERHETSSAVASGNLNGHVQLLATIAERVARRSPVADQNLVATCISNASQYHGNSNDAQMLIALNAEIREIVMGRIAALAFDFSFHNRPSGARVSSAFANPVAIEKLCAVLAANAISSGPKAVQHFLLEWIIPSVQSLPPFSVACVVCHIAIEALRKSAPAGTKDALQRLSHPVIGCALGPILAAAVSEGNDTVDHDWKCRVAAVSLLAVERWSTATDLSLPQIKHICSKQQINFVEVISDALYSDSLLLIDAMAELLEHCLQGQDGEGSVSKDRMTQARYIMVVDEETFRSISPSDLFRIESKELHQMLGELVSAVGLQRFRFVERQSKGDFDICRNLTRIGAAVGGAALPGLVSGQILGGGSGLLDLLLKASSHPSVHVCGLSLDVLSNLVPLDPSFPVRLLPILQHRAIIPHIMNGSAPSILASAVCGVDCNEFENFRENTLANALQSCYAQNPEFYMDSCTSAIEEFCASEATVAVSFQLEAAMFCLNAISVTLKSRLSRDSTAKQRHDAQLTRCAHALAKKPIFITANPLTLAQLNRFLGHYGAWFGGNYSEGVIDIAAELALASFSIAGSAFPNEEPAREILKEMSVSPFSEAATALRILLTRRPGHFTSQQALTALGGGWESSYKASNQPDALTVEDRIAFCNGMCHVFASLPAPQRAKPFHAFALPTISCLRSMLKMADGAMLTNGNTREHLDSVLARVSDEIYLVSAMATSFQSATRTRKDGQSQSESSEPSIDLLNEVWPSMSHAAQHYGSHECISKSLGQLLMNCLPSSCQRKQDFSLLKEICSLLSLLITQSESKENCLQPVYEVIERVIQMYGEDIDRSACSALAVIPSGLPFPGIHDLKESVEACIIASISIIKTNLGSAWTRPTEQGQGQPAFESKNEPVQEQKPSATGALSGIFGVLEACTRNCPFFLIHLPTHESSKDRDVDSLLKRAVESAVASIGETDDDLVRSAVLFLKSMFELMSRTTQLPNGTNHSIEGVLAPVRKNVVRILLYGVCGGFHSNCLDPAASLLYATLRSTPVEESRSYLEVALRQERIQLSPDSLRQVAGVLEGCSTGEAEVVFLMELFEDLWELHQVEDRDAANESDLALRFKEKYSRG